MKPGACIAAWLFLALAATATAHDFKLGPLPIDHPCATPTPAGAMAGAAYLRTLGNTGGQPDHLIGAATPVARTVEIHRSVVDAQNVMRIRAVDGIDLPPTAEMQLRHGGEYHLMPIELMAPMKHGGRYPMTLRFEKAGEREVMAGVQQPRSGATSARPDHMHGSANVS